MLTGIPDCLLVVTVSETEFSEELAYLRISEYTKPNLLHTKSWEFLTQD